MPDYKVSVFFEVAGGGWSENHYIQAASAQSAANSFSGNWAEMRRALVIKSDTHPVTMVAVRAGNVVNPLDSFLESVNIPGTFESLAGDGPDMPWTGILARIIAVDGTKRSWTLRGIPDLVAEDSWRSPPLRNKWNKAWFDLVDVSRRLGCAVRSLNEAANPLVPIASIVSALTQLTVTTAANHGLVTGDTVSFRGVKALAKIQGRHRVTRVSDTIFTVNGFNVGVVNFLSGFCRKVTYTYPIWDSAQIIRKTFKKAGRPYFLLRGRR